MTTYFLGIQWSRTLLRLACFKKTGRKTELFHLGSLVFDEQTNEQKSELIRQWIEKTFPKQAEIQTTVSISESEIILKELHLPNLTASELSEAIYWELTDKSSIISSQSSLQWQIIDRKSTGVHVSSMVMKKQDIQEPLSVLTHAGLQVIAIEPSSISVTRTVTGMETDTSILLMLEESVATIIILSGSIPVFSTSFGVPISDIARKSRRFSRDTIALFLAQLKRTILYWKSTGNPAPKRIVAVSDTVLYSGMKRGLSSVLDVPLVTGGIKKTLWANAIHASDTMLTEYAVSVGASLRFITDTTKVNFLPKEQIESLNTVTLKEFVLHSINLFAKYNTVFAIILVCLLTGMKIREMSYNRTIAQTRQFVTNHPAQKSIGFVQSTNDSISKASTLIKLQQDTGEKLRYLSSVTPSNIRYTSIKMSNAKTQDWTVEGIGQRSEILAFYNTLVSDKNIKDVTMPYSNVEKENDAVFRIQIVW